MGIVTYRMAVGMFKQKLRPVIACCTGYQQIIRKDVNCYLAEHRGYFRANYQKLIIGFMSLKDFEKRMKRNDSPFELYILKACCPEDIDIADLRSRLLDAFLDSLQEAMDRNSPYCLFRKRV